MNDGKGGGCHNFRGLRTWVEFLVGLEWVMGKIPAYFRRTLLYPGHFWSQFFLTKVHCYHDPEEIWSSWSWQNVHFGFNSAHWPLGGLLELVSNLCLISIKHSISCTRFSLPMFKASPDASIHQDSCHSSPQEFCGLTTGQSGVKRLPCWVLLKSEAPYTPGVIDLIPIWTWKVMNEDHGAHLSFRLPKDWFNRICAWCHKCNQPFRVINAVSMDYVPSAVSIELTSRLIRSLDWILGRWGGGGGETRISSDYRRLESNSLWANRKACGCLIIGEVALAPFWPTEDIQVSLSPQGGLFPHPCGSK